VHLLAAYDSGTGEVLGQAVVDGKTNEISAFTPLLDRIDIVPFRRSAEAGGAGSRRDVRRPCGMLARMSEEIGGDLAVVLRQAIRTGRLLDLAPGVPDADLHPEDGSTWPRAPGAGGAVAKRPAGPGPSARPARPVAARRAGGRSP